MLPPGVRLLNWYDQSRLVTRSATSVCDAVLNGRVLAGMVLMLFLCNLRRTLLACAATPATLAITIIPLRLPGLGFNIMTLGGIAAAVGLLIDDAIVMIEHLARSARARRRVAERTRSPASAQRHHRDQPDPSDAQPRCRVQGFLIFDV